jgi:ribose/xylose/arabinose/galactoside ABC-type transport system permease subunit
MAVAARPLASGGPTPILFLAGGAFVLFAITIPGFASLSNIAGILLSALPLLLLATGQTFVLVSGGIDLSAPSVVGLVSVAGGLIMSSETGLLAVQPAATGVGLVAMMATGARSVEQATLLVIPQRLDRDAGMSRDLTDPVRS